MLSDKLVQEYKEIFEKKYKQKLTDSEARDQAERLAGFFKILYDQAVIDHRRKLRLKKEKIRGFFLEDEPDKYYTCAICGETHAGPEIWWNTKGLRCKDCWANIKKKVIPSLGYDYENKIWLSSWRLQTDYSLHSATIGKLRRQGILKGRDLIRGDGIKYCTVYLIKENEKFFKKYPKKPSMKIRFVKPQQKSSQKS
jgi:DNA-directed RNA polymerase subunit RPC12/RpoP